MMRRWKHLVAVIVVVDLFIISVGYYFFVVTDTLAGPPLVQVTPTHTPTITPTPWAGPPTPRVLTPTPTTQPTPLATTILAESGFPVGFTPTPRPTDEPVYIKLPEIFFIGRNYTDAPTINQVLYPEPFFAAGTNNACGPVSLYAGFLGLGLNLDYRRVRDVAVSYGFNAEGISKSGMVNTATVVNQEIGSPYNIEHGNRYRLKDVIRHLRQGAVVVVLVRVKRAADGRFHVTTDSAGSIGHFLLVERINIRSKTVRFAGSTLGMETVPLGDFVASWTSNPHNASPAGGWSAYLKREPAVHWALILKPAK